MLRCQLAIAWSWERNLETSLCVLLSGNWAYISQSLEQQGYPFINDMQPPVLWRLTERRTKCERRPLGRTYIRTRPYGRLGAVRDYGSAGALCVAFAESRNNLVTSRCVNSGINNRLYVMAEFARKLRRRDAGCNAKGRRKCKRKE